MIQNRYKHLALKLELDRLSVAGMYNLGLNYLATKTFPANAYNQLTVVQIESTLACNLKCKMCVREYFDKKNPHLTFENFKTIIDQFPYLRQLNLTGIGEPLLNKDIFKMVEYAKSKKIYVRFTTNATLLAPKNCEKIILSGLDELRVSLDGATAETFEDIREGSCFLEVIGNIRALNRLKQSSGAEKPVVEMNTVVLKENFTELPRLVELAAYLDIKSIYFSGLDIEGAKYAEEDHSIYDMSKQEIEKIFAETKEKARELGVAIRLPGIIPQSQKCFLPWLTNYVTLDGDLMPCCHCIDGLNRQEVIRNYALGNLLEQKFEDIWNAEKYRHFRKRLNNGNLPGICKNCSVILGMD